MFTQVKVTTLDAFGREVETFYAAGSATDNDASLADIVHALDAQGETVISARYVR